MRIARDATEFKGVTDPICMAAGFFDGVHTGHASVLNRAIECATATGSQAWVLTFDTHPAKVLRPDKAPPLLTAVDHKLSLLEAHGIDGCLLMPFTHELAAMTPEDFAKHLCFGISSLKEIVVGRNWRFGAGQKGTPALLAEYSKEHDITVSVIEPVIWNGDTVSSSRIREAVLSGLLDDASKMLGRRFSVVGTVTRGKSIGRTMGFPTANIDPHNEVLPPAGVYAVHANVEGTQFHGVANIGSRPTFEADTNAPTILELHLPGIKRELYGVDIEAVFVAKLRDEKKFGSSADLKLQIAKDVQLSSDILSKKII
jgi:riboflavin kinase/FMN adenylyltransferase